MIDASTQHASIIIADDHPLFRVALKNTIERLLTSPKVLEAEDFQSLQELLSNEGKQSQLILLDLHMPGSDGFSALIHTVAHYPEIPVMVVSAHDEPSIIRRAMDHGANGFLPKSAPLEDMSEALQSVLEGGLWKPEGIDDSCIIDEAEQSIAEGLSSLTQQQFRVAGMVNQGLLNKQIAYELKVTEATIKAHMTEIFRKLGVHSRTQVALALGQLAVKPDISVEEFRQSLKNSAPDV